jgi:hypothetical protein
MDAPRNAAVDCAENPARSRARTAASLLPYLAAGIVFGFVAIRSEIVSWYRIQEMFRFQSFHMYGVIGSAVVVGAISVWLIKRSRARALDGSEIVLKDKDRTWLRYILGGTAFGLGWGLVGACPGPILALIGAGLPAFLIVLVGAILGTWTYGVVRDRLPHG